MRILLILLIALVGSGGKPPQSRATAVFAGGCFWSAESAFEDVRGVLSVTTGYTGGTTRNPTYASVSAGGTRHREAVEVIYDPAQISYAQLVDIFWRNIDPTNGAGQFCDYGEQYLTAIFVGDDAQRQVAVSSKQSIERTKGFRVVTDIFPAGRFYRAEEYHQDFAKKNPVRYQFYRFNCGRDAKLRELWGSPP